MLDKNQLLPREKALKQGFDSLTDQELLAIILRTGSKGLNVLKVAELLLNQYHNLLELSKITYSDLIRVKGIKNEKAVMIIAIFELSNRIYLKNLDNQQLEATPSNIYNFFRYYLENKEQECFVVVFVNVKNFMTGYRFISQGTLDVNIIHPRDVFREAIRSNASRIILVHNHPSGDPKPSCEDINATKLIIEIGKFLKISVIDHIIIGKNKFACIKVPKKA